MHCYFAVSKVCNLRCRYCYVPEYNKNHQANYDSQAVTSARRFSEKIRQEVFPFESITLHGAEPSILSAKALGEVIQIFRETTRNQVRIQSNGTRFTESYLNKLLEVIGDPNQLFVGISIDGSASIHNPQRNDTWDRVMDNIKTLRRYNFEVGLLSVITPLTIKHLQDFGLWVESVKPVVQGLTFKLGEHGFGLSAEENKTFADWLYESRNIKHLQAFMPDLCMHDGNNCEFYEFDIEGNCYSCNKNYGEPGIFANWFEENFEKIVAKRQFLYGSRPVDPECEVCPYQRLCRSGCPLSREEDKSVDCLVKKTIYAKLLRDGIRAEAFFPIESQSTSRAMQLARYEDLPLAEARVVMSPRLQSSSGLTLNRIESNFLKILLADHATTIGEALDRLGAACPDIPDETLVHEALTLLKRLYERDLLSFAS
ncbi:MAG: radical SAM protein [Deltaproteobacteria bacterium]|nr:radical SAM protein [Deltaproteobacteria bacterium]